MTFKDLNVGDTFYFTSNFSYRCTKLSARTYNWKDAFTHNYLTSTVGSIDVEVRDVEKGK